MTPTPICGCPETASSICTPQSGSSDAEGAPCRLAGQLGPPHSEGRNLHILFLFNLHILISIYQLQLPTTTLPTHQLAMSYTNTAIQLVRLAPQILLSKMKTNTPSFGFYRPVPFPGQTCLKNNLECQIQIQASQI